MYGNGVSHGWTDGCDLDSQLARDAAIEREQRRKAILTRGEFMSLYELSNHDLSLLLRREDFVRLCCLTSESGEVVRIIPGQVKRWLEEGDWTTTAEAARAQAWGPIVASAAEAVLRAVRTPGG